MRVLWMSGVLCLLSLSGCSLVSASGLDECQTSEDCGKDKVCTNNLCLPLPFGCEAKPQGIDEPGAIVMGALIPVHSALTPPTIDESDEQAYNATLLALSQINERSVNTKHITLYFCDTYADRDRARAQADWMVKEKKVSAILTGGSGQTLSVAQFVTVPANVATMSYSATAPELKQFNDKNGGPVGLLWRTSPSDSIQGTVIANLLRSDTRFGNPKRVGILYVNGLYGQGLYNIISEQLNAGTGIASQGFSYPEKGDIKPAMEALNAYDPDLTVLMGFADDVINILTDAANRPNLNRNVHKWFFSDSVKDAKVIANPSSVAYAQAQSFFGTAPAQGSGQAFNAFRSSFQSAYKRDPNEYAYTSNAYDAMYLLALGAAYSQGTSGSVTGTKIAEGLTKLSATQSASTQLTSSNFTQLVTELAAGRSVNVDGASGTLDFNNDTGEAPSPVELWQVNGTNFRTDSVIAAPKG